MPPLKFRTSPAAGALPLYGLNSHSAMATDAEMKSALLRTAARISCILLSLGGCAFIGLDGAAPLAVSRPGIQYAVYVAVFILSLILGLLFIGALSKM